MNTVEKRTAQRLLKNRNMEEQLRTMENKLRCSNIDLTGVTEESNGKKKIKISERFPDLKKYIYIINP